MKIINVRLFLKLFITFAVKIVREKAYTIVSQSDDLALHSRSQLRHNLDKCLTCTIIGQYLSCGIQTWHADRLMHDISAHARFDDLDLDLDARL